MSETQNSYRPVNFEKVHEIPAEAGIVIDGFKNLGKVRPFGFYDFNSPTVTPVLRVLTENGITTQSIGIYEMPGIHVTPRPVDTPYHTNGIGVSFRYYKATKSGQQEKLFRDIVFAPDEPCIGYGVLPDLSHDGEEPTWYMRGYQVGNSQFYNPYGRLVHFRTITEPAIKNFSMARIVGGLIGDPATDPEFRDRMGITLIPE